MRAEDASSSLLDASVEEVSTDPDLVRLASVPLPGKVVERRALKLKSPEEVLTSLPPEAHSLVPKLFQERLISKDVTKVQEVAQAWRAFFEGSDEPALDIKCYQSAKGLLLYALAVLPQKMHVVMQVLTRQKDSKPRVRLLRDMELSDPEEPPEVFFVNAVTKPDRLRNALSYHFFNKTRTRWLNRVERVTFNLRGAKCAAAVLQAVELLQASTLREFVLTAIYDSADMGLTANLTMC